MKPEVTIIIPVHNRASLIERTLDSVAAQTVRPLALVVADNASTDGSADAARAWADARPADGLEFTLVTEPRPGAANARNAGFAVARTPWVMFFDSDDTMDPNHVARALDTARANPGVEIIGWDVERVAAGGGRSRHGFYTRNPRWHNIFHGSMSTQRYMVRADLLRRAGLWHPKATVWDDIELGERLLRLRPRLAHAGADITVHVYEQAESISGLGFASRHRQALATLGLFDTADSRLRRCLELKRMILAADCAREGEPSAPALRGEILRREPSALHRLLLAGAYAYRRAGGRGAARLLKPWFALD